MAMVSGSAASGSRPRLAHQASVLPPGGAVGPARAVAAGAGGVDRGAAGEFGELGGAVGAVRDSEGAEADPSGERRSCPPRRSGPSYRLPPGAQRTGDGIWLSGDYP